MDCPRVVKGMRDILPPDSKRWHAIESVLTQTVQSFGYEELRSPVLESIDLFKRTVGETTDIVEKEMYAFEDQGGQHLCLRPEGTASTVRALINAKTLNSHKEQRLYYTGPMFRRERSQKGRYRQFFQFGIESFGFDGPDVDVEQVQIVESFWKQLGINEHIQLEINSLGDSDARQKHKTDLVEFYNNHKDQLDEDSKRRLDKNPLRILDSKNPAMIELNQRAPKLLDYLSDECRTHFENFKAHLDALGIKYVVNPSLVRGLDYYTRTVFEWTTDKLGAQSTVCAGGRYDKLVSSCGGPDVPGCGFALGIDRLLLVHEEVFPDYQAEEIDLYWIVSNTDAKRKAWQLAEGIRQQVSGIQIVVDCGSEKFKQQFKRADRTGARIACILGEDELANDTISLKFLREERAQESVTFEKLIELVKE